MNELRKHFALSLAIHGVLFCLIYAVSSTCAQNNLPIVIDFNVDLDALGTAGPGLGPAKHSAGLTAPKAANRLRSNPVPSRDVVHSEPHVSPTSVTGQMLKAAVEHTGPVVIATPAKTGPSFVAKSEISGTLAVSGRTGGASGQGESGTAGGGNSGPSTGGGGATSGLPGGGGASADQLKSRYMKEHFTYIKDLIQRSISYPVRARKMGWTGKVVVSFTVHETGRVSNEVVVSSSGFELLDNNVISTIKAVSPFPRPPVKAELRVPIVYHLE